MTTPREELAHIARQVRAWAEWSRECGGDGLVSEAPTAELLDQLSAGAPAPVGRPRKQARPIAPVGERVAAPPAPPPAPPLTAVRGADERSARALAPGDRKRRLQVLTEEVSQCTRCVLHEDRTQTVFARGNPDADLMFVGEGPGFEEDRQGYPFVGPAGQLLDKMIAAMGYHRDDVYIANIVKCRPPKNRKPTEDETASCAAYLREQIELVSPKVMVALGATGVQGLLGTRMGITRMRGTWKTYRGRIPLMPTFHPAYLLRSPEKKRDVWNDLQEVMRKLGKEPPSKKS